MSVADTLSRAVNTGQAKPKAFAEEVMKDHRTLQQLIFGLFLACVKLWATAYDEGRYDARNEATVKASKKIVEALGEDAHMPYI